MRPPPDSFPRGRKKNQPISWNGDIKRGKVTRTKIKQKGIKRTDTGKTEVKRIKDIQKGQNKHEKNVCKDKILTHK